MSEAKLVEARALENMLKKAMELASPETKDKTIMFLLHEIFNYRMALEEIVDPIKFLRELAEADNCTLDGNYCQMLSNDANYLKSIAIKALEAGK